MEENLLYDCPKVIREYLSYMRVIKGRSENTINAYYIDLRTLLRFMKRYKKLVPSETPLKEISISDLDVEFMKTITMSDVYEFLLDASSTRSNQSKTLARKISAIRVFFKYLTDNIHAIEMNPVENLETPKQKITLPKYLTLEECYELLTHIDGDNKERDFCIVTLFLNCGMRLSELSGMNLSDIRGEVLLLRGKGNKERIVYLSQSCIDALAAYIKVRNTKLDKIENEHKKAVFINKNNTRLGNRSIELIVKKCLENANLGNNGYSPHKLRHTAATMMYQHGNVDLRVLQEILGHTNLGTTQIYTHIADEQLKNAASSTPLSNIKPQKMKSKQKKE